MCGAHDVGVLPLGGPVVAGDQAHAVQATKVAEHEGIAGFRLVRCAIGEREVPGRVLRPTMSLEELVLLGRGVRLWDGLEGIEQDYEVEAISSPSGVTHVTFTRAGI